MMTPFDTQTPLTMLLAVENEGGEIIRLVVFLLIAVGSVIVGWIKKRQEDKSQEGNAPPSPPPSQTPQRPWPPTRTTTGTTIPGPARPVPPRTPQPQHRPTGSPPTQRPPIAMPVPAAEEADPMRQRAERIEAEMRRRAEQIERQMKQRAQQMQEAAARAKAEEARLRAAAQEPTRRILTDDRHRQSRELPHRLQHLLAQPNWRTAIIMAEILSPPVALRDPNTQTATSPPSLV